MEISGKQFKIKETSSCSFQVYVETVFWLSQKTGSTKIAKSKIQKRLLGANLKLQSTYVCWGHWITTKTLLEQCMKRWEKQGNQIHIDRQTEKKKIEMRKIPGEEILQVTSSTSHLLLKRFKFCKILGICNLTKQRES